VRQDNPSLEFIRRIFSKAFLKDLIPVPVSVGIAIACSGLMSLTGLEVFALFGFAAICFAVIWINWVLVKYLFIPDIKGLWKEIKAGIAYIKRLTWKERIVRFAFVLGFVVVTAGGTMLTMKYEINGEDIFKYSLIFILGLTLFFVSLMAVIEIVRSFRGNTRR